MASILDQLKNVRNNIFSTVDVLGLHKENNFNKPLYVYASVLFKNYSPSDKYRTLMPSNAPSGNTLIASRSKDEEGKIYPVGVYPDVDTYKQPDLINPDTGSPVERGHILESGILNAGLTKYGKLRNTNDLLNTDVPEAFRAFEDGEGEEFLHRLDKGDIPISYSELNDVYLSSFVSTDEDNEDPVIFSYDLIIKYDNSPLFNGSVEDFIQNFSSYTELSSRIDLISKFKEQFFKFFKIDTPTSVGVSTNTNIRTYYLKKISGLENLTESILPNGSKQFANYGSNEETLVLTLNEDVSMNMGYLSLLYKILTYSKRSGKKMIPDNLLRFDMEIVVTEARKYNRLHKREDNSIDQYADLISRYRYKIYECQFFFDKSPHGDSIDMWNIQQSEGFDLKINYKFSTVKFEKFTGFDFENNKVELNYGSPAILDSGKKDLTEITSGETNTFRIVDNTIQLGAIQYNINKYKNYAPVNTESTNTEGGDIQDSGITQQKATDFYKKRLENLYRETSVNTVNLREQLMEKTLQSINSEFKLSLSNIGGTLLGEVLSGFDRTEYNSGFQYNLPAWYANRTITNIDRTLGGALGLPPNRRIYDIGKGVADGVDTKDLSKLFNDFKSSGTLNKLISKL